VKVLFLTVGIFFFLKNSTPIWVIFFNFYGFFHDFFNSAILVQAYNQFETRK